MNPELGNFALALACCMAAGQAILPLIGAQRRDTRLMALAPALAIGQMIALITAFACLVHAAITNDFSVQNVAANSAVSKPLLYKITGVWGNHEGSVLLWAMILSICGGAVALFGRNLPSALQARVIGVLGGVAAGFELFCLTTSNPFARVWPAPLDGQGMNRCCRIPASRSIRPFSTPVMLALPCPSPSPSPPCLKAGGCRMGSLGTPVGGGGMVLPDLWHRHGIMVVLLRAGLGGTGSGTRWRMPRSFHG